MVGLGICGHDKGWGEEVKSEENPNLEILDPNRILSRGEILMIQSQRSILIRFGIWDFVGIWVLRIQVIGLRCFVLTPAFHRLYLLL